MTCILFLQYSSVRARSMVHAPCPGWAKPMVFVLICWHRPSTLMWLMLAVRGSCNDLIAPLPCPRLKAYWYVIFISLFLYYECFIMHSGPLICIRCDSLWCYNAFSWYWTILWLVSGVYSLFMSALYLDCSSYHSCNYFLLFLLLLKALALVAWKAADVAVKERHVTWLFYDNNT